MDSLYPFILAHAAHAHWLIFGVILLAGMSIPISIDLVLVATALMASRVIPEHAVHLYLAVLFGCYFAGWIAYAIGRWLGPKILHIPLISKILSPERLEKAGRFYKKHCLWARVLGRFIPFGVRNCLFMSAGLSRMPFLKFAYMDAIACFLWSTLSFYLFYTLGHNYEAVVNSVKVFNLAMYSALIQGGAA